MTKHRPRPATWHAVLVLLALVLAGCAAPDAPRQPDPPDSGGIPPGPTNATAGPSVRCRGDPPDATYVPEPSSAQRAPVPRWCPGDQWTWRITAGGAEKGRATWTVAGFVDVNGTRAYEVRVEQSGSANHTIHLDVANLNEVWDVCADPRPVMGSCRGRMPRLDFPLTANKTWTHPCCGDVLLEYASRATFAGEVEVPMVRDLRVPAWHIVEANALCSCTWTYVHATHWGPFLEKWFTGPDGLRGEHWVMVQGMEERIPADRERLDRSDEWWNATVRGAPGVQVRLPLLRSRAGDFPVDGTVRGGTLVAEPASEGNGTWALLTLGPGGNARTSLHRATISLPTTGCVAETYLDAAWTGNDEQRPEELAANASAPVEVVLTYHATSNHCGRSGRYAGNATQAGTFLLEGRDEATCS